MSFPLKFDARTVEPILEFTAEMRQFSEDAAMAFAYGISIEKWIDHRQKQAAARREAEYQNARHKKFTVLAGGEPDRYMTLAQAKKYARTRSADQLRAAFEFLEDVMSGKIAVNLKDRIDVAYELIKRAVGNHSVLNAMADPKQLAELAPVDAIDSVMKAYGNGEVDEQFVKTLLGLLGAKVNGLKIEQELDRKSAQKVSDRISKPPSGKVV
jgi:hypothetical protein